VAESLIVELLAAVWGAQDDPHEDRHGWKHSHRVGPGDRLVEDPGEQAVIARLIHLRDDGRTWKQVAEALGDVLDPSGVKKVYRWETATSGGRVHKPTEAA
jgi:hypothetical protein